MSWLYLALLIIALWVIYRCFFVENYTNHLWMKLPAAYLHNNVDSYEIKKLNKDYALSDQNECRIKDSCSR